MASQLYILIVDMFWVPDSATLENPAQTSPELT